MVRELGLVNLSLMGKSEDHRENELALITPPWQWRADLREFDNACSRIGVSGDGWKANKIRKPRDQIGAKVFILIG